MPDEECTDLSLLRRIGEGNRGAFNVLMETYQVPVLRFARLLCQNDSAAEEVLQETFLSIYQHASSFRGDASAKTWIYRIARNKASKMSKRRAGEPKTWVPISDPESAELNLAELGAEAGWGDSQFTPEALAERAQDRILLQNAIDALQPEYRQVLILRDVESFTGPETAEILNISLANTKTRLHRARLQMMSALRKGGLHGR